MAVEKQKRKSYQAFLSLKRQDSKIPTKSDINLKVQIYDTLKWLKFVVNYCNKFHKKGNGIENAWISLLMISFGTTYEMDRFIWVIPLLLCLILRPYAYNFIAKSSYCKIYLKAKIIAYLNLFSVIGVVFIIASSEIKSTYFLKRIIVCTIGWTITGLSLGLTSYLVDEMKVTLENDKLVAEEIILKTQKSSLGKNQHHSKGFLKIVKHVINYLKQYKHYPILGEASSYAASAIICLIFQGQSFSHFYKLNNIMYGTCAILHLLVFFYLIKKSSAFSQKVNNYQLNRQSIIKLRHSFQELKRSNIKDRIYLVIHFIICFIVDAIVMLGTYWVASINEKDFNLGLSYCYGVKIGSVYVVLFMIISNVKLPKIKHWGLENTLDFMKKYTIFYLLVAVICFILFEEISIFTLIISGAVLVSLYRNKIHLEQMKQERFRNSVQIIEKGQKFFRVSMFPLFINLVFGVKAYPIWINMFFLSGTLIGVLFFIVDVKKHNFQQKTSKDKQN